MMRNKVLDMELHFISISFDIFLEDFSVVNIAFLDSK